MYRVASVARGSLQYGGVLPVVALKSPSIFVFETTLYLAFGGPTYSRIFWLVTGL